MKKQLVTMISIAMIGGFTLSGCDLFNKAKEELKDANLDEVLGENSAETEECQAYWERYRNTQDEEALTMYQKYCLKNDDAADAQAEEARPESIKNNAICGDLYDRAYILADSIYFENAGTCDFNVTQACKDKMQPVKDLVKRIINECNVAQSEIYVRRFIEGGATTDIANCSFPMYIPSEGKSVEVKCQQGTVTCEAINGKHQEKWEKADGSGNVFVACAVECPPGYFFDMNAEECKYDNYKGYGATCGPNEFVTPEGACKPVVSCPQGQYTDYMTGTCVVDPWFCPMGYFKPYEGAPCEEDVWAKACDDPNAWRDASGKCVNVQCNWDEYYDDAIQSCVRTQQCGPNQGWSYNMQKCVTFENCGPNQWFDIEMGTCQQDYSTGCAPSEMWSWEQNRCIIIQQCAAGEYFDVGRGHCRIDDKPFNDMVIRELSPKCSDLFVRMDGDDNSNPAFTSFLTDCIDEFIEVTLPQGTIARCQPLYREIMGVTKQFFQNAECVNFDDNSGANASAACMTIMDAMGPKQEEFKTLKCAEEARRVDPYWVFLAGDEGGEGDNGPQCPDNHTYNKDYDYCEPNQDITVTCPTGMYWNDDMNTCMMEKTDLDCGEGMEWDFEKQMCRVDAGSKIFTHLTTEGCKNLFHAIDSVEHDGFNATGFNTFIATCEQEFRQAAIDPKLDASCTEKYNLVLTTFINVAGGTCSDFMDDDTTTVTTECQTLFNTMDTAEDDLMTSCPHALDNLEYPYILK